MPFPVILNHKKCLHFKQKSHSLNILNQHEHDVSTWQYYLCQKSPLLLFFYTLRERLYVITEKWAASEQREKKISQHIM